MSLPKINEDSFKSIPLLSGKKIGIKPWRTKQEKELLFAIEDNKNIIENRKEIVNLMMKCVDDLEVFKTLSNADYIYLLAQLRKISKGAKIEYVYRCTNPKCKFELSDDINLDKHLITTPFSGGVCKINDKITFNTKEVSFLTQDKLKETYIKNSEFNFNFIIDSIDSIGVDGEMYSEITRDEIVDFVDDLSSEDFNKLSEFVLSSPAKISLEKKLTCGRCKTEMDVQFGDLYNFLAL